MGVWHDTPGGFPGRAHYDWLTTDPRDSEPEDRDDSTPPHASFTAWRRWCREQRVNAGEEHRAWVDAGLARQRPGGGTDWRWERLTAEDMASVRAAVRAIRLEHVGGRSAASVLAEARIVDEGVIRGSGEGEET